MKAAAVSRRLWAALLFLAVLPAGAQEVAEQELRSAQGEVVFINYEGPYERIDTADEIKGLGYYVAAALRRDGRRGSFLGKYSVIRAIGMADSGKFDADIFSIDADAKVDHIDNVRRILGGYLEGAFRYSAEDARTLARFATVYNAVHRGDLDYFGGRYKPEVITYLSPENAGISTRYYEWPGATRLLIPLTPEAAEGRLSSLDTGELSEKGVIEEMRRQPDMGLEDRKDMVELKERQLEEQQSELEQGRQQLAEDKSQLEEKKRELAEARTPEERKSVQEEVTRQETKVQEGEAKVAQQEEKIQQTEGAIAEERQRIVGDERSMDQQGAPTPTGAFVASDQLYYLKVRSREASGSISGTLSIINPDTPEVVTTSPLSYIRGRAYYFLRDSILVVANESGPSSPVRLFALDPRSLKAVRQSAETVYPETSVLIQGGSIYAVISAGAEFRLARFDGELRLGATSPVPVDRDSSFSIFENRLLVNAADRSILFLDRVDLRQLGALK
jgi:hypothetical protein